MTAERPTEAHRAAAARWLARRDGSQSAADEASFAAWRDADLRHAQAYDQAEGLWAALGAPLAAITERSPGPKAKRAAASFLRPRFAALAIAGALVLWAAAPLLTTLRADVATSPGETALHVLPDGSTARLGPDAALTADFEPGARRVTLLKGEIYFEVAPDPHRPFTVDAGDASVRVVGTAFDVDRAEGGVTVTVKRGAVRVIGDADTTEVALGAGQQVAVVDGRPGEAAAANVDAALAWMSGRLVFDKAPLGRVVESLQRQTSSRIVLRGSLADRRVSGTFPTTGVAQSLAAAAAAVGAQTLRITPWVTVVY